MRPDITERFWAKVDRSGECWVWTASRFQNRRGILTYGMFLFQGRLQGAHRVAWVLTNGAIPDGLWVLHRCDNPPCVRPDHLSLGTHRQNVAQMVNRGRCTRGEAHHSNRFTEDQVRAIRRRLASGESDAAVARELGVKPAVIWFIRVRRNWGWLND